MSLEKLSRLGQTTSPGLKIHVDKLTMTNRPNSTQVDKIVLTENYIAFLDSRHTANRIYYLAERNNSNSLKRKLEGITHPHLWWAKLSSSILKSGLSFVPPLLTVDGRIGYWP